MILCVHVNAYPRRRWLQTRAHLCHIRLLHLLFLNVFTRLESVIMQPVSNLMEGAQCPRFANQESPLINCQFQLASTLSTPDCGYVNWSLFRKVYLTNVSKVSRPRLPWQRVPYSPEVWPPNTFKRIVENLGTGKINFVPSPRTFANGGFGACPHARLLSRGFMTYPSNGHGPDLWCFPLIGKLDT
jgi:hypothetical protein